MKVQVSPSTLLCSEDNKASTVVIKPATFTGFNVAEIWKYRELLYFLVWRDLKVRYKQTLLGVAWALIQPLCSMIVFTLFFGKLAKVPSDGIPYPIFVYSGLLIWQFFSRALTEGSTSLTTNERILTKIYFPRILFPISTILAAFVDFAIGFAMLLGMMLYYHTPVGWPIVLLPFFLALALLSAIGTAVWLSGLNVQYRDVRYLVPFINQFWLFITPVIYPSSLVPERWRWLYGINPMAGVVEGFRHALFGTPVSSWPMMWTSSLVLILCLLGGLLYFNRVDSTAADVI